jgi:hypothetical protein
VAITDLSSLHALIARAMVTFALASGGYGLWEYFHKHEISPSYWGIIVVGNVTALGQGMIGLWLALGPDQKPVREWVHILYGIMAVLWIPIFNFANGYFNRKQDKLKETLIIAIVSLFEFGVALRAIATSA